MGYRDYMRDPAPSERPPFLDKFFDSPATWVITGLNIAVYLGAEFIWGHETLLQWGASMRSPVWAGEYWRFITPIFIHIGFMHLFWNCYAGFGWLKDVEHQLGTGKFVLGYLMAGIAGCAASLLGQDVVSAGASGAGFGMIGVTLSLYYFRCGDWDTFINDLQVRSIFLNLVIWTAIGFFAFNMDHFAHGGGLVCGFAYGYLMTGEPRHWRVPAIVGFIVLWTALVVSAAYPWFGQETKYTPVEEIQGRIDRGDYLGAAEVLEKIYLNRQANPLLALEIGQCYESAVDYRTALTWYHKAEAGLGPAVFERIERCYRALGEKGKAEEYRRKRSGAEH